MEWVAGKLLNVSRVFYELMLSLGGRFFYPSKEGFSRLDSILIIIYNKNRSIIKYIYNP